jgi:hypothetical protein
MAIPLTDDHKPAREDETVGSLTPSADKGAAVQLCLGWQGCFSMSRAMLPCPMQRRASMAMSLRHRGSSCCKLARQQVLTGITSLGLGGSDHILSSGMMGFAVGVGVAPRHG